MYFDFEDRYEDYRARRRRDPALGWRACCRSACMSDHPGPCCFAPPLPFLMPARPAEGDRSLPPPQERPRFVFVQPRARSSSAQGRRRAPKPPTRTASRAARDAARAPRIRCRTARGNSRERVEATPEERRARPGARRPSRRRSRRRRRYDRAAPDPLPQHAHRAAASPLQRPRPPQGGSLGEALRNLQKYVDQESFGNDKGQVQNLGPLQFDTKGVEFGPWIRRFVAQVRRNWFVPYGGDVAARPRRADLQRAPQWRADRRAGRCSRRRSTRSTRRR